MTPAQAEAFIARFYEPGYELTEILLRHSCSVGELALDISHACMLGLDDDDVMTASLLHDIGIFLTDAPGIYCQGHEPYIRHGVLGAALLRSQGMPEWIARVAERHTGVGLTSAQIREKGMPLPDADFVPETLLEKLVCYADKFYSKSGDMQRKKFENVRASIFRKFPESLERFDALHKLFIKYNAL